MDALKEIFNKNYYSHLADETAKVYKNFKTTAFVKEVTANLEALSLNQRLRNTSVVLKKYLPDDFKKSVEILTKLIPNTKGGYSNLVFPDFVGLYGQDDFEVSMKALHYFTQFGSSEFAIREFLKRDFDKTIKVMQAWSKDKNAHVRRLACEGSRPRLPWSFKLDAVIQSPEKTRSILEALKSDEELYVRKSVANHLNDISKENPDYMLKLIHSWDKNNKHTAWIIKHASRTLIKKGHAGSLSVFDFEKDAKVKIENFNLSPKKLILGKELCFEFDLISEKNKTQKLVIDYVIQYRKKSGELAPKVFKLKELHLPAKQKVRLSKKQWIKDFTTRKHFAGIHLLELQINGQRLAKKEFEIVV